MARSTNLRNSTKLWSRAACFESTGSMPNGVCFSRCLGSCLTAGKKITGRKRHLAVVVHGGYWQNHDGAIFVLGKLKQRFRRIRVVFADAAYKRCSLPE